MNDTEIISETTVTATLPVQQTVVLDPTTARIVPCDEPACIWKGGHTVDDLDPDFLHQALRIDEAGYAVEVNRPSFDTTWTVWAMLDCDDGRTSSPIARDFTHVLEIAEDIAAELNTKHAA